VRERERGVSGSSEKKAVRKYPVLKSVKGVLAFPGLASFYRKLVPEFAKLAKPLKVLP
jgi:hypothetical protein